MYETEIVLGLMASASALYGFYLAYYTFARSLQFEERVRIYDSSFAGLLSHGESNKGVAEIERRRETLGYFFLGASASFLVSVFSGLLWLAYPLAWLIPLDGMAFAGLALLVIPLSYYAGKNLKEARDEQRKLSLSPDKGADPAWTRVDEAENRIWKRADPALERILKGSRGSSVHLLLNENVAVSEHGYAIVLAESAKHFSVEAIMGVIVHEAACQYLLDGGSSLQGTALEKAGDQVAACDWGFEEEILAFFREHAAVAMKRRWQPLDRTPPRCS